MADAQEISIEGEVERVTFENRETGFRVVKVAVTGATERVTVVGVFPPVAAGARVRVRGTRELDRRHGEQLRAIHVTELAPNTLVGIEKYLGSGLIKGVGERTAARIVERFGLDTLRILEEAPERLREVEGIGKARVAALIEAWNEQRAVRDIMVFLQAHGATPSLASRILKRYGPKAVAIVSRDPYRLAVDVWGIGFRTADRIASSLGVAADSPERMRAAVLQAVRDTVDSGHCFVPTSELYGRAGRLVEIDADDEALGRALESLAREELVVCEDEGALTVAPLASTRDVVVYGHDMHALEERLATRLATLGTTKCALLRGAAAAIDAFEAESGTQLADEQRAAVEQATERPLLVVTGGPGVGKTTVIRAITSALERAGLVVRLTAPTGRAAKRMSEATGRDALTLHRLLEFDPKTGAFRRDASHPIDAGAIIVDESSMVDVSLADALTQAVSNATRLVFVGDVDQLPSVGPGAVLRDAIESRVIPCVRLTRIFRQAAASRIVTNAHRINRGEPPEVPDPKDRTGDFYVIDRRDADLARQTIVELVVQRVPRRFGFDPVRDIQVLTPMNRGPVGAQALNEALQAALNPSGPALVRAGTAFRLGDKVMQLRNDYDKNVYNGDVGVITLVDEEEDRLVVRFDEDVPYDVSELDQLTLAYACTIHKSQGSEYPVVVVPMLTTHFVMLSKNLLYTAVTRGRRLVVLVADPRAIEVALSAGRRDERRTRLAARIARAADAFAPPPS